MRRTIILLIAVLLGYGRSYGAETATKYLRFPDVHGNQVVFSYAGDLWLASTDGGLARHLTSGAGLELFPKFSPDGKWIAFTGQYTGDEQVYVIPAAGGAPRQLTHYPSRGPLPARWGYDNQVVGWTPDGKSVLFRSLRDQPAATESRLYNVPVAGGNVTALPMYRAGAGVFSPDGTKVLYSPTSRDFRTWKRYQGGWAEHLYIADLAARTLTRISHDVRTERDPMWTDRGIFFLSDRDGRLNLYSYDSKSGETKELTHFTEGDAKFASADRAGDIVFEYEGSVCLYDAASGTERRLDIQVPAEDTDARPHTVNVSKEIQSSALSPDGRRVLFVARGDIFVERAKGETAVLNLTHSSDAHEREAAWSPDGRSIAFVSDASGDEELWTVDAGGSRPAHQVTHGSHTRYYGPVWSPDGRRIAMLDADGNLFVVDLANGAMRKIGATEAWYSRQYAWSPDGRYIVYPEIQPNDFRALKIWDSESGQSVLATDPSYDSFSPAWSPDGRFLWFLSVRDVNLQVSQSEWDYAGNQQTRIFALALQKDAPNPFAAEASREGAKADEPAAGGARVARGEAKHIPQIDLDGLASRLIRVPLKPDNYDALDAGEGRLVYLVYDDPFFGPEQSKSILYDYDLNTLKARKLAEGISSYVDNYAADAFLTRKEKNEFTLVSLKGDSEKVDTSNLRTRIVPREEWAEIFNEVWRRYRDYFYDPKMHGRDWQAVGAHYRALLPAISDRADLNYLMGEMVGELNVSHAYVFGGAEGLPDRPKTGLLGARLELDVKSGHWKFVKIFEGDNGDPFYRSPLTEVGSRVKVGEYLLAINGEPLPPSVDPYSLLAGEADKIVELTIGDADGHSRQIRIKALASEAPLIRLERTLEARRTVDRLSGGTIGYVHISDMGPDGLKEFVKDWYGQIRKDGMIVDVRGNLGGSVSRMILERLVRPAYTRGYVRGLQIPQTFPWGNYTQAFTGEIDMLANEDTMSDGDTISWTFKQTKRGKLIGKRTWGGVIGTGNTGPLLDGGEVEVPQFALTGPDGEWIIEGKGVTPDIEVDNDGPELRDGEDAQLVKAVHDLQSRIVDHPGTLKGPQPVPPTP